MDERPVQKAHRVTVNNRGNGTITGVLDVRSFDEKEIVLETSVGMLFIKGSELHVSKLFLEQGDVDIDGKIDSFTYSDKGVTKKEESLVKRFFG